jgi:hypothetical protein
VPTIELTGSGPHCSGIRRIEKTSSRCAVQPI